MTGAALPATLAAALKEWAVQVDALARGRQIVLLRKGGIAERRQGFQVEHRAFWLYPTYEHQNQAELRPEWHEDLADVVSTAPPAGTIALGHCATVARAVKLTELERLERLADWHPYTLQTVRTRFHYRSRPELWVVVLRVYRRPEPVRLAETAAYAGCVSWVTLDAPLPTIGAAPVVSDDDFAGRLAALERLLEPTKTKTPA